MTTPYDAGPRLSETIEGDRYRQAVAALGGFAYQLLASALAWLDLRDDDTLYLEVAEDYATVMRDALTATQVKATTTSITLLSPAVGHAIDSLIDLKGRNPERFVTLRFLTTAPIGKERSLGDRPNGIAGLEYWRHAAAGADVGPLRVVLLANEHLSQRVKAYIVARDDEALRRDLLQRIHWDADQPEFASLRTEFETQLTDRGIHAHGLSRDTSRQLVWVVLGHLLEIGSTQDPARRALKSSDLDRRIDAATRVSIRPRDLDAMLALVTGSEANRQALQSGTMPPFLRREDEVPLPAGLSQRPALIIELAARLPQNQSLIIIGGTGTGKTTVARLTARAVSGSWIICQLPEGPPDAVAERLSILLLHLGSLAVRGVILDDFAGFDAPETQVALARVLAALRRRDQLCLMTTYREPTPRVLASVLLLTAQSVVQASYLDVEETTEIIAGAGGDGETWAHAVHNASSRGHPQLAHAIIMALAATGWPEAERATLLQSEPATIGIDAERTSIRRRVLDAVPDTARALLYRTSLVLGPFRETLRSRWGKSTRAFREPGRPSSSSSVPGSTPSGRLRIAPPHSLRRPVATCSIAKSRAASIA